MTDNPPGRLNALCRRWPVLVTVAVSAVFGLSVLVVSLDDDPVDVPWPAVIVAILVGLVVGRRMVRSAERSES